MKPKRKGKTAPRKSSEVISDATEKARREREVEEEIEWDAEEEAEQRSQEDRQAGERRFEKTLSKNPIVAAVQRALRKKVVHVSIVRDSSAAPEADRFIDIAFGSEVAEMLGKMLLRALMDGDRGFADVVLRAIKQIDTVFNRNREIALAKKVRQYVWSLPEPLPAPNELKTAVEQHCNHGRELSKDSWLKLRRICLIPIPPRGAPKKKKHRLT